MSFLRKLFGKKKEEHHEPSELEVAKQIRQALEARPPGPERLAKQELKPGDERRHCTRWQRTVVLSPAIAEFPGLLTCEWSLCETEEKQPCLVHCVHNSVTQMFVSTRFMPSDPKLWTTESLQTLLHSYTLKISFGIEDYAPSWG